MEAQTIRRILVADDDPVIRELLQFNLRAEGYAVEAVEDGIAACEFARTTSPDLVVLDVMMPGCDGLTALRELRADPATAHLPVVLLTAKATDEEVWQGWEAGADYYLTKPFDIDQLLTFLHYLQQQATPTTHG